MFRQALSAGVSELQSCSPGASSHLSPAWVLAGAKHYASRLHTLAHTLLVEEGLVEEGLVEEGLAAAVHLLAAKREPTEMVGGHIKNKKINRNGKINYNEL